MRSSLTSLWLLLTAILAFCRPACGDPVVTYLTTTNIGGSGFDAVDFFYEATAGAEFTCYQLTFGTSNGGMIYDPLPGARGDSDSDAVDTFMNTVASLYGEGDASYLYGTYKPGGPNAAPAFVDSLDWVVFDLFQGDTNTYNGNSAPYHLARVLIQPDTMWHATMHAFDSIATSDPKLNFTNDPTWTFPEPVMPLPPPPPPPTPEPLPPEPPPIIVGPVPPPAEPLPPLETPPQPGPPEAPPIDDVVNDPPSDDLPVNDPWEAEPPIDEPSLPEEEPSSWIPQIDPVPLPYLRQYEHMLRGRIGTIFPWDGESFIEVYPWADRLIDVTSIVYEDGGQPFTTNDGEGFMLFHTGATGTTSLAGDSLTSANVLARFHSSTSAAADSGVPEPTSATLAALAFLISSLARGRRRNG
jgi:hypothetical protein